MYFVASRKVCRLFLLGFGLLAACAAAPAYAGPYILIEASTGRVIAQHEAGRPWYPASISKLMTVFVAFRAMREGRVTPNTLLTVSQRAYEQAPTKMGFPLGTQVTLDNALKMLMVKSANDMAVAIAEGVGGTYDNFIAEMNRTAAELGMTATHYANPNGLPDEGQITSARDMAILAREIYKEFPEQEALFRIPAIRLGKRLIRNHNRMIDHYPGADGMKTGFICAGGFNIVATATRGDKKLIAVVLGGRNNASRNEDAAKLFEKGFSPFAKLGAVLRREPRTVESIENLAIAPPDVHDLTCGKGKRRIPIESDVDDDDDPEDPDSLNAAAASAAGTKGAKQPKKNLFVDLPPSMQPVRVFIGPPSQSEAQKAKSGDEFIPKPRKVKVKGRKGKKAKTKTVGAHLPSDEEIAPVKTSAKEGPVITYPAPQPTAQVVAPAAQPAAPQPPAERARTKPSAADSVALSEGLPLPRKPQVLDAAQATPAPKAQ